MTHQIKTTVVGSYPIPMWLGAMPSTPALRDAILVVMKTQELAGIDVISDGELSRFDPNHPENQWHDRAFCGADVWRVLLNLPVPSWMSSAPNPTWVFARCRRAWCANRLARAR